MQHPLQAELDDLRALPARQRAEHHRLAAERVLDRARQPALLAQLAERISAPRRVQQVGAEERVVREVGGDQSQRLGVVGHDGALAAGGDELVGPGALAHEHLGPLLPSLARLGRRAPVLQRRHGEAPRDLGREQLALGRLGRTRDHRQLGALAADVRDVGRRPAAHARGEAHLGHRRRRSDLGIDQRFLEPAQGVTQLVLAKDLADARAVGRPHSLGGDVEVDLDVALGRRQAL